MQFLSRILSRSLLAFAVIFGVAAGADHVAGHDAKAGMDFEKESADAEYVEPWYDYWGNTGHDGSFILEQEFVNAVAYQNFTINGYEIDGSREAMEEHGESHIAVEVYDQQILKYADGKALGVTFPVNKGAVSKADLFAVYGETENTAPSDPDETAYYTYSINGQYIQFITHDNWVTDVRYGGDLMSHS